MKNLIVVLLSTVLAQGYKIHEFALTKLNTEIVSKIDWEGLGTKVEEEVKSLSATSPGEAPLIVADVTNFTLAVLENVGKFINTSGLEPTALADNEIDLFPGSLILINGTLSNLSTITVSDAVILKYAHVTGILELTLPIAFDQLVIAYNYKATVLPVSVSGSVSAIVNDVELNLRMGFNFSEYHSFVDTIDVKNSGSITIDFKGLGPLDYLIELLTNSLTTLFHGIILGVVDAIIYDPVSSILDQLNSVIDSILHPNSTTHIFINYY